MDCTTEPELIQLLKNTIESIQKTIKKNKELYLNTDEDELPEIAVMRKAIKDFRSILKMYE